MYTYVRRRRGAGTSEGDDMASFWKRAAAMLVAEQAAPVLFVELAVLSIAANDTAATKKGRGPICLTDLRHKDHVRFGQKYGGRVLVGHHADIEPKKSIRLHGHESNHVTPYDYDLTFKNGDVAVYGGYNLTYTGKIVSIGEKTVRIAEDHSGQVHALDVATFSDWNRGFDLEKIQKRNSEWMD
jgi:hypothetical protein